MSLVVKFSEAAPRLAISGWFHRAKESELDEWTKEEISEVASGVVAHNKNNRDSPSLSNAFECAIWTHFSIVYHTFMCVYFSGCVGVVLF